jgi:hypothetical protein
MGRPRAPWHLADQYGFVLEDVVSLPFRPLKGRLGFFETDASALALLLGGVP